MSTHRFFKKEYDAVPARKWLGLFESPLAFLALIERRIAIIVADILPLRPGFSQ